jgi:hypothetical protein
MRFTEEVDWTPFDFMLAGVLIGSVGGTIELTVKKTRSYAYRGGVACALASAFLTIWATGAVGMIGSEDGPFNLLFLGVIALALVGAVAACFRATGMARAMLLTAIAQAGVSVAGLATDPLGGIFGAAIAGVWLLSAALFRKAALKQTAADRRPHA